MWCILTPALFARIPAHVCTQHIGQVRWYRSPWRDGDGCRGAEIERHRHSDCQRVGRIVAIGCSVVHMCLSC